MGFLDWLDPTRKWPVVPGPAPDLNRTLMQLDSLRFGDTLERAHFLGRPDRIQWHNRLRKSCDLFYAQKGLRLRFVADRLTEWTFLIGPNCSADSAFVPARPKAPDGTRLSAETDRSRIVQLFGEPDPGGSDDTCLQIFHGNVASDFRLDNDGHLDEWVLYPND
jgi:hypothetical protein